MKNLKSINILGQNYKIIACKKPLPSTHKGKPCIEWGSVTHNTIRYYDGCGHMTADSVLHEVIHAIMESINQFKLSKDEDLVHNLAGAFTDTIQRNPNLLPFLQEKLHGQ